MDESLTMEIWDTFKEYIPEKNKETAAHQYVDFLLNHEIEIAELESYIGYDNALDVAIRSVVSQAAEWDDPEPEFEDEDNEEY
jgi:hypothetical protein